MLGGAGVIFALTSAVLILGLMRPGLLRLLGPERLMLWGGLIIPSFILGGLLTAALLLGERLLPRDDAYDLRIEVTARQWGWEFHYPAQATTAYGRLLIPAGRDISFSVTSADVIHGFWIPRLGGKIDAIPGQTNRLRLRADRPGVYGGVCAEYCGAGHPQMGFVVEALPPAEFDARMQTLAAPRTATRTDQTTPVSAASPREATP